MIGIEDPNNEEEPELKVTDRRKFNPDGTVREGVTLEPEPKKEEPMPAVENIVTPASESGAAANQVLESSAELLKQTNMLRSEIDQFLKDLNIT